MTTHTYTAFIITTTNIVADETTLQHATYAAARAHAVTLATGEDEAWIWGVPEDGAADDECVAYARNGVCVVEWEGDAR